MQRRTLQRFFVSNMNESVAKTSLLFDPEFKVGRRSINERLSANTNAFINHM